MRVERLEKKRTIKNIHNDNFPTGIPIPLAPKSPKPKILSPSVTTITLTEGSDQLFKISLTWPRSFKLNHH